MQGSERRMESRHILPAISSSSDTLEMCIRDRGVNVLLNTGAGWGYEMTPAELTKKDEFYSIYWKEYNAVKNGMNSELKELPDYLEKRPVFEAKA